MHNKVLLNGGSCPYTSNIVRDPDNLLRKVLRDDIVNQVD